MNMLCRLSYDTMKYYMKEAPLQKNKNTTNQFIEMGAVKWNDRLTKEGYDEKIIHQKSLNKKRQEQ